MFSALKKVLGIQTISHCGKPTEAFAFSGSAYFSKRVPKAVKDKWVVYGGEISSGTILDARTKYFFATDPSDPWVTKLFAKSVMVIHAGWIMHCVDKAFQVPITEYILDDKFIPGLPYKFSINGSGIYVPLSKLDGPVDTESRERERKLVQSSDTPSTPTSLPRKRTREQAYFDSPSGSLVFSEFDKDGVPLRPRKQRRLRFDPSPSPKGGRSDGESIRTTSLYWLRNHQDASAGDDESSGDQGLHVITWSPSHVTTVRAPDTPDKPFTQRLIPRYVSLHDRFLEPSRSPSSAAATDIRKNIPPIRTIDFTNLPPPTRRWRFPEPADDTKSRGTTTVMSIVRSADHKAKTPKKISFADHARVCVYTVPPPQDTMDGTGADPAEQRPGEDSDDGIEANGETRMSSDLGESDSDSAAETMQDGAPQTYSRGVGDNLARHLGSNQFEDDDLTLKMDDVEAMRYHLLESAAASGVDDGSPLAIPFELGKTFRGKVFRHVW